MRAISRWLSAAVVALIVACGSSAAAAYEQTHSAKQIVSDAGKSTGSATSFHLAVAVTTQEGQANADFDVAGRVFS